MLQTLFDLLSAAATSKPALEAERQRLLSTLVALRSSLASTIAMPAVNDVNASKGQFSNAASDLFCQAKLIAPNRNVSHTGIRKLALRVEEVLALLNRGQLQSAAADHLLVELEAQLAALGLPNSTTSRQSAA